MAPVAPAPVPAPVPTPSLSAASSAAALAAAGNPLSAIAGIGDLNRAKPAALQAAKARMEVVFDANRVARGDAAFVYDRRVEHAPTESSDWDDE